MKQGDAFTESSACTFDYGYVAVRLTAGSTGLFHLSQKDASSLGAAN